MIYGVKLYRSGYSWANAFRGKILENRLANSNTLCCLDTKTDTPLLRGKGVHDPQHMFSPLSSRATNKVVI